VQPSSPIGGREGESTYLSVNQKWEAGINKEGSIRKKKRNTTPTLQSGEKGGKEGGAGSTSIIYSQRKREGKGASHKGV